MVDHIMDRYLDDYLALDPLSATYLGVSGHDDEVPDLSPDGLAEVSALRRRTLAELDEATAVDETDRITVAAASEQLRTDEEIRATGAEEARLNNIESPVQSAASGLRSDADGDHRGLGGHCPAPAPPARRDRRLHRVA